MISRKQRIAEEEAERQAGQEAAQIGGPGAEQNFPPSQRAVREAGGGEAEGFEEAEAELIENASHSDQTPPEIILQRQITPEKESDRAGAEAGEADHQHSSQKKPEEQR